MKIVKDNDNENFCKSTCDCDTCKSMNSSREWVPENKIQERLKTVIEKIEKREKEKFR